MSTLVLTESTEEPGSCGTGKAEGAVEVNKGSRDCAVAKGIWPVIYTSKPKTWTYLSWTSTTDQITILKKHTLTKTMPADPGATITGSIARLFVHVQGDKPSCQILNPIVRKTTVTNLAHQGHGQPWTSLHKNYCPELRPLSLDSPSTSGWGPAPCPQLTLEFTHGWAVFAQSCSSAVP